jgi:SpoVK/Ycf46/Vps4 family AAA+-type ATPase
LQEKRSPVFVAATANEIASLPPELLRKGRFDEIFFVDLPSEEERRAIFAIQLAACGRDPERFDLARCAASSPGFSGAEIREAVISGLFRAFAGREQVPDRELRDEDLRVAIADIQPLSRALAREMRAMVQWAQVHARPASGG